MKVTTQQIKNFRLQLERASKSVLTESDISALKRAINPSGSLPKRMKNAIDEACANLETNITKEQSLKGINYLKNSMFTKKGDLRNISYKYWPSDFGYFEENVIRDFKKFTFCGFWNISENSYDCFVPLYKVISKSGDWFIYTGTRFDLIQVFKRSYE